MKNLLTKVRRKKLKTGVDLTAMVSVSFLLIIFFMVVGELSKPKIIALGLPERYSDENWTDVISCGPDYHRVTTILLDDNDKIITYSGLLEFPDHAPKNVEYGQKGIRKELSNIKSEVYKYTGDPNKGLIVIIKPSEKSNYGNLVDILDEMAITNINTYTIVNDFTPEETNLLASK